ncbi:hypothetical protein N657DRAFT_638819 [Parathielavia appendiculata]|uniref:Uncharacterized protein n=1 Tax=Parathielavia appendiculata TaxID=2587402 RepID=A0AAN6Z8C1_9PEZI|nr:hypothetical protein N657DRAFT_638819 [Parathielavia appendiculata]
MRKTGLPIKRANPVPFGVRAIQSGIEIDGIWISRPASLNELSSITLAGRDSDSQKKGRDCSGDERSVIVTTSTLNHAGPRQSPSAASIFQKLNDTDSMESSQSSAPPVSQFASRKTKRHPSRQLTGTLNEDTLRRLEGQSPTKPLYETYVPTSSFTTRRSHPRPPRHLSQQSSASSSAESVDSQPRSEANKSASGRSYTSSSHSSKLYMATAAATVGSLQAYAYVAPSSTARTEALQNAAALRRWAEKERDRDKDEDQNGHDPLETSPPRGFFVFSQPEMVAMAAPEPTFGPGDLHLNTSSRRVNDGFEVLPAGTFGSSGLVEGVREGERGVGRGSRSGKKLRKSGGRFEQQGGR